MALTSSRQSQCGAVLALTLFMLVALSLLAVSMGKDILLDHALSASTRASLNAHLLLDSGKRLAAAVLVRNSRRGDPDRLNEPDWGIFDSYLTAFSSQVETTEFTGSLVDENCRFPLAALFPRSSRDEAVAEAFSRVFTRLTAQLMLLHGYDAGLPQALQQAEIWLRNLRQWSGLAPLDETARRWYLSRVPARLPRGTPPLGAEELTLVYWPDMDEAFVRALVLGTPDRPGLAEYLTVWGSGPLNVNTALPEVLTAFGNDHEQGKAFAETILRQRVRKDAKLEEGWYLETGQRFGIALGALPPGVLDVRSRWYRLEITILGGKYTGIAVGWVSNDFVHWEYQAIK